jgi:hypothetical protein
MSASRPGRFTSQKDLPPLPSYRRLRGPHSRSGRCAEEKMFDLTGTRTTTPPSFVQFVVNDYRDGAKAAFTLMLILLLNMHTYKLFISIHFNLIACFFVKFNDI